jgi:hypothetical protein
MCVEFAMSKSGPLREAAVAQAKQAKSNIASGA